jgi:hypothetical protein
MNDTPPDAERMLGQQRRWARAIVISGLAIIGSGVLFLISPYNPLRSPRMRSGGACVANLKTIYGGKATWALEKRKPNTAIPTDAELYGATNYIREKPRCPAGGTYLTGRVDRKPRCTFPGHTF